MLPFIESRAVQADLDIDFLLVKGLIRMMGRVVKKKSRVYRMLTPAYPVVQSLAFTKKRHLCMRSSDEESGVVDLDPMHLVPSVVYLSLWESCTSRGTHRGRSSKWPQHSPVIRLLMVVITPPTAE